MTLIAANSCRSLDPGPLVPMITIPEVSSSVGNWIEMLTLEDRGGIGSCQGLVYGGRDS